MIFFFLAFVLFLFLFLFFVFCFYFLFINNLISSSICKLPIRSEIYNCTFKNTNKVSITIIIIIIIIIIIMVVVVCVRLLQSPLKSSSGTVDAHDHITHATSDKKVTLLKAGLLTWNKR